MRLEASDDDRVFVHPRIQSALRPAPVSANFKGQETP